MDRSWLLCPLAAAAFACARPGLPAAQSELVSADRLPRSPAVRAPAPAAKVERLAGQGRQGSAVLLGKLEGRLTAWVADEDDRALRVVDVDDERELSSFTLPAAPSQMVMLADGRLVVSLRTADALAVVTGGGTATSPLRLERLERVTGEPVGLAVGPHDRTLLVTRASANALAIFDTATWQVNKTVTTGREPRAVLPTTDGKRAFVSHAMGKSVDLLDLEKGVASKPTDVTGIEEVSFKGSIEEKARVACQGFALAMTERGHVLAPHVLVFSGEPSETSAGYGGGSGMPPETFHVPVIDELTGKVAPESKRLHGDLMAGETRCALPRDARVSEEGLFVTCLGDDAVVLYDADAVNPHEAELRRWTVPSGPTGIAIDSASHRAVVWSQFAHALTTLAIDDHSRGLALSSTSLPRRTRGADKIARGRTLFHTTTDDRISTDGRACASCHPDGRDDGLVWSSPKGPRQTPTLAGRLDGTAPYGWNGDAKDVNLHLTQTVKRLGGKGLAEDDKDALVAYVRSLPPPRPSSGESVDVVARGRAIFASAETGCATCHGADGTEPDGEKHDVKSWAAGDTEGRFDTPSLRFVGNSAPYFHDGRYADLSTLLAASDGKMGKTKHLGKEDMRALEAYLRSL